VCIRSQIMSNWLITARPLNLTVRDSNESGLGINDNSGIMIKTIRDELPTIRDRDNSAPFATIRDFGNDDSGLAVYNNSGLWQRQFGTSIRTSARNYRLFGTTTIWVPFIQIVVNCHFFGKNHILHQIPNRCYQSPESSLPNSPIVVYTKSRIVGLPLGTLN
jgi:hypothetical protein